LGVPPVLVDPPRVPDLPAALKPPSSSSLLLQAPAMMTKENAPMTEVSPRDRYRFMMTSRKKAEAAHR
jgi:hypothetical protein